MPTLYIPPFTLTSKMLHFVAEISGEMGRLGLRKECDGPHEVEIVDYH